MNTCGTCKHFGPLVKAFEDAPDDQPHEDDRYVPVGYHRCKLIEMKPHRMPPEHPIACVVDASGYHATLCVKEEFGCNQWEAA